MGKGEIARYEQCLLFQQCFQKACFPEASKGVIVWEWVNCLPKDKILYFSKSKACAANKINMTQTQTFVLEMVEIIVLKGENAAYQHFFFPPLPFSKVFFL